MSNRHPASYCHNMRPLYLIVTALIVSNNLFSQKINTSNLEKVLSRARETHTEALIIYQKDKLITETYFGTGNKDTLIEAMSTTKSIVGLAVACLLDDRLIDTLDTPLWKYYPEWNQGTKKFITIRHLVNMTSGLQNVADATAEIYPSHDFVQLALAAEMSATPGTIFNYNNKSLNLMAGLIKKITGKRMDLYIAERLFKPLEITSYGWTLDEAGNPHVMAGCQIRPIDHIKMGLLLLNKGMYNGRQVISQNNIEQVVQPCQQFPGYGMLWWIDHEQTVSIIDNEIIDSLVRAGIPKDFIDKAKRMKGEYKTEEEYFKKVIAVFGENPWAYIDETLGNTNLRLRKKEFRGRTSYLADGYLGNYIVVDPADSIVALRMTSYKSAKSEADYFPEFKNLILNLTK